MHPNRCYIVGLLLTCCVIAACSRPPERVGPKFSGRLLLLAEDRDSHSDLVEITAGSGDTYNHTVLASGLFEAVASPDQTRLLYSTIEGVFLREVRGGPARQLAPPAKGGNSCLAWSPDGNRFSYRSGEGTEKSARTKLYFSDLEGKAKLIWESYVGGAGSECGHWLAPNHLIFDRLLGVSPQKEKAGEVLLPNTTTIVTLGDRLIFVDAEKKWSIDSVCQFGKAAVVRPAHESQPVLIAKNLNDLKAVNAVPVSCSGCRFAGFAARSCVPFFLESADSKSTDIFSLNPLNWQRQKSAHVGQAFSATARTLVSSSAGLMIVGEAPSLLLVNTESGDVTSFFPKSEDAVWGKKVTSIQPLVWIEN